MTRILLLTLAAFGGFVLAGWSAYALWKLPGVGLVVGGAVFVAALLWQQDEVQGGED